MDFKASKFDWRILAAVLAVIAVAATYFVLASSDEIRELPGALPEQPVMEPSYDNGDLVIEVEKGNFTDSTELYIQTPRDNEEFMISAGGEARETNLWASRKLFRSGVTSLPIHEGETLRVEKIGSEEGFRDLEVNDTVAVRSRYTVDLRSGYDSRDAEVMRFEILEGEVNKSFHGAVPAEEYEDY